MRCVSVLLPESFGDRMADLIRTTNLAQRRFAPSALIEEFSRVFSVFGLRHRAARALQPKKPDSLQPASNLHSEDITEIFDREIMPPLPHLCQGASLDVHVDGANGACCMSILPQARTISVAHGQHTAATRQGLGAGVGCKKAHAKIARTFFCICKGMQKNVRRTLAETPRNRHSLKQL